VVEDLPHDVAGDVEEALQGEDDGCVEGREGGREGRE